MVGNKAVRVDTLACRWIHDSENITNTDGASALLGVFGNFNYFLLGRRAGAMVIEADPYSRFAYADTGFRMITRWGLAVGDANSFCRILAAAA